MIRHVFFLLMIGAWSLTDGTATLRANGYCGDGVCQGQSCQAGGGTEACEEWLTCPMDCAGETGPGDPCGNGYCSPDEWQNTYSCPQDCSYGSGGGGSCPDVCNSDISCTGCQDKPYCISGVCRGNV
jgi:hypothetical protein